MNSAVCHRPVERLLPAGRTVLRRLRPIAHFLLLGWALLGPGRAWAHRTSDAYVVLAVADSQVTATLDLPLRDVTDLFDLDRDGDAKVTWGEILDQIGAIEAYTRSRLVIRAGEAPCELRATRHLIDQTAAGPMLRLEFAGAVPAASGELEITYRLLFDFDAQHRALAVFKNGHETLTQVFGPERTAWRITTGETGSRSGFLAFLTAGVEHILGGVDHVLFLLALLLPSVFRRADGRWEAAPSFGAVWPQVLAVVTAFTLAHSVTLGLAVLDVWRPPSRWVESLIGLSVGVAALNNLKPCFGDRSWGVAGGFGLLHGFGFAGALGDLGLAGGAKAIALLGFNLGVEAGQLALVALFLPLAFGLRETATYRVVAFQFGSVMILLVGLVWTVERGLGRSFLPF